MEPLRNYFSSRQDISFFVVFLLSFSQIPHRQAVSSAFLCIYREMRLKAIKGRDISKPQGARLRLSGTQSAAGWPSGWNRCSFAAVCQERNNVIANLSRFFIIIFFFQETSVCILPDFCLLRVLVSEPPPQFSHSYITEGTLLIHITKAIKEFFQLF